MTTKQIFKHLEFLKVIEEFKEKGILIDIDISIEHYYEKSEDESRYSYPTTIEGAKECFSKYKHIRKIEIFYFRYQHPNNKHSTRFDYQGLKHLDSLRNILKYIK